MDTMDTYRGVIKENISYDILCERYGKRRMDEAVALMLEAVTARRATVRIAKEDLPAEAVKSRLLKVDALHLEYVFDCFDANTTKIRNIKSYLLTAIYNAPATMESYYKAAVNHGLYWEKEGSAEAQLRF